MKKDEKKVLGIVAIVLAAIALIGSWMPLLNNISFIIAIPALILGVIGLLANRKRKKTLALIGTILSIVSMAIVLSTQSMYSKALDDTSKQIDTSIKESQRKAEDSFKWTKADFDVLKTGDTLTGEGGTNYEGITKKFGKPTDKSESSTGDYATMSITYDNMGASEYKSVNLDFTKQNDGSWLLTSKYSNGL